MSIVSLVKGCPLFHEIYENEINIILKDCFVATFEKGDKIINQGDESTDICILLSGKADITINKDEIETHILSIGEGDLFGELVLINETKRTANIVATRRCDVLVMSDVGFYSLFKKKPEVFALMVLNLARLVTKRLKKSNKIIESIKQKLEKNAA
ncbi:MAG: cyclic nucleotide-binding domain-containing protein [Bacteriovoracaceae bacterium]|jgi:CRP/FNR family transcriptional regulator, cyclic AMP receptor protein|nr:cyclic nucleotide-binding domain-containing protein [Bacteriovoracaceae bacterium]